MSDDQDGGHVFRCHRCRRFLGRIYRLDGELLLRCKCGATNRLAGVVVDVSHGKYSRSDVVTCGE